MPYKKNPTLKTVKKGYKGNEVVNGRFVQEYNGVKETPFLSMLYWKFFEEQKGGRFEKALKLTKLPPRTKDSITWIGHASVLITLNKKRFLIDPILTTPFYFMRRTKPCCKAKLLDVDYVLITHDHRDHLDKQTIKKLPGNPTFLVPLGVGKFIKKWRKDANIQEAGWWQQYDSKEAQITFLPARHWPLRTYIKDKCTTLWGSYLLKHQNKSIYISGDTGYTKHFKDIQDLFPEKKTCILPASYFKPEGMHTAEHMGLKEAAQAYNDLNGKTYIPYHYGTIHFFDQFSKKKIMAALKKALGKKAKELNVLRVGETTRL